MLGPSSNPILIAIVNVGFFVGAAALAYLFGLQDSRSGRNSPSI